MHARPLIALLLALALLPAEAPGKVDDKPSPRIIEYRDDKVTLSVVNVPAEQIVAEIAKKGKAEVHGSLRDPKPFSGTFDAVPLPEALERLLGAQNFTLTYGDEGLKVIHLKGGPEAPEKPKEAAASGQPEQQAGSDDYPQAWIAAWKAFEHRQPVPIQGKFAELVGKNEVNWDYVVNMAYGYDDPKVRTEAVVAGLKALDDDPDVRDAAFASTSGMSDSELATFARTICKHMAEDFVKRVARHAANPDIKARAKAVLREIRQQERLAPRTGT
jgi:hypothetical protein